MNYMSNYFIPPNINTRSLPPNTYFYPPFTPQTPNSYLYPIPRTGRISRATSALAELALFAPT